MIVGIGARRGVSCGEVMDAVEHALNESGIDIRDVELLATSDIKEKEDGIRMAAGMLGKRLVFLDAFSINSQPAASGSAAARLGLAGVCEPCALFLSKEKKLLMKKKAYGRVTVALAR